MKQITIQKLQDLYNMPWATQEELTQEAFKRLQRKIYLYKKLLWI